jgi:hypothetical protein
MQSSYDSRLCNTSKSREHVRLLKHTLAVADRHDPDGENAWPAHNVFDNAPSGGENAWRTNVFNDALPSADQSIMTSNYTSAASALQEVV